MRILARVSATVHRLTQNPTPTLLQSEPDGTYKGFMDCARKTYKSGGATVFFRGLMPALVRAFPLHAGVFLGFETTMRILDPDRINHMDEA